MSVIQQMNDDWLPVQSRPRVIFQFATKSAVFGHLSQLPFLRYFREISRVFSETCKSIPYQGFESCLPANQSGLCPASLRDSTNPTRIQDLRSHTGR